MVTIFSGSNLCYSWGRSDSCFLSLSHQCTRCLPCSRLSPLFFGRAGPAWQTSSGSPQAVPFSLVGFCSHRDVSGLGVRIWVEKVFLAAYRPYDGVLPVPSTVVPRVSSRSAPWSVCVAAWRACDCWWFVPRLECRCLVRGSQLGIAHWVWDDSYSSGIAVSGAGVSRVSTDCSAARRVELHRRRTHRPPALCEDDRAGGTLHPPALFGGLPAGGTLRPAAPLAVPSGPSTSMSSTSSPTVASAGISSSSSVQTPLVPSEQRGDGCAQYWKP